MCYTMGTMSAITLRPVKRTQGRRSNRFCGPSVLSILTGLDTADTARLLRQVSGRRRIMGTSTSHLKAALSRLGIDTVGFPTYRTHGPTGSKALTFVQWERQSRATRGGEAILLVMGHHWAVVQGRRYACGISHKPVPFSQIPHRCARVTEAYRLIRVQTGKQFASLVPPPPVTKADVGRQRREQARKLAATYGIQIEDGDYPDQHFVYPPSRCYDADGLWPDGEGDPLQGERSCYSWGEVLAAVRVYADAIEASRAPGQGQVAASPAPVEPQPLAYRFEVENGCGDVAVCLLTIKPGRTPRSYCGPAIIKVMHQGPIPNEGPWKVLAFWPEGREGERIEVSTP